MRASIQRPSMSVTQPAVSFFRRQGRGRADLALPRFGGFDILLSGSNDTSSITVR